MKKYEVRLYYHTSVTFEVEADNEEDAIDTARNKDIDFTELADNLCEDDEPDVIEIERSL